MSEIFHLKDEVINEYLDDVLEPKQRKKVDTHLERCSDCTTRLDQTRKVFTALEMLPDAPLESDLSLGVLEAIAPRLPRVPLVPVPVKMVFLLQAIVALVLLVVFWPFATRWFTMSIRPLVEEQVQSALSLSLDAGLLQWQMWKTSTLNQWTQSLDTWRQFALQPASTKLQFPMLGVVVLLVAASLLWLAGNSFLLKGGPFEDPSKKGGVYD